MTMGVNDLPAPTPTNGPSAHDLVIADITQRKQFGLDKYGTTLQPGNGRDSLKDAYEEVLDHACYLRNALAEREQANHADADLEAKMHAVEAVRPMVALIAHTKIDRAVLSPEGALRVGNGDRMRLERGVTDPDHLAEFAGRACYQSFGKPNPATARNAAYLAHIQAEEHESVLEHGTATFYLAGVSRALTHELIRHRHLSYSQLSQRFVDEKNAAIVVPPALRGDTDALRILARAQVAAQEAYTDLVTHLTETKGLDRKPAREAARAVLPNMTETRIVVSGNHRAWRDVLARRCTAAADAEIREVGIAILKLLKDVAPATYQDFQLDSSGGITVAVKTASS